MAEFLFTSPTGEKFKVTAPEGATESEAFAMLNQQQQQAPQQTETPTSAKGAFNEMLKGLARGAWSLPKMAGEALAAGVPEQMRIPPKPALQALNQSLTQGLAATPQTNVERMLGTGGELAGGMLPFAGMGAGGVLSKAANIALPTAGGVAGEQLGGEKGKILGSIGAPLGAMALGKVLSPRTSAAVKELSDAGVTLTPGQILGGTTKKVENLPIVNEITGMGINRSINQFNTAVINRALSPIGGAVDEAGFAGIEKAHTLASQNYTNILQKVNPVRYDATAKKAMANVLVGRHADEVQATIDEVVRPYLHRGVIDPVQMKQVDSELGRLAAGYRNDPSFINRELGSKIYETQAVLRDMVARQNPAYAEPLRAANRAWGNLIRVENAAGRAGSTNGVFTPEQFMQAIKSTDKTLNHSMFAQGRAPMQDFARAGIEVLGKPKTAHIPYAALRSLTIPAALATGASAGVVAPTAVGAGLGLAGLYSPMGQAAFNYAAIRRPEAVRKFGEFIKPSSPIAGASAFGLFGSPKDE